MVRGTAGEVENRDSGGLTEPTVGGVFLTGLPGFVREGFVPIGALYLGLQAGGLAAGIAVSAVVSVLIYVYERRANRDGLLVRISLAFVAVRAIVGLIADSSTAYLAPPVAMTAICGLAFLASAVVRRPLAGALAATWYPFPTPFRQTEEFKRVFGIESIVWGIYLIAQSALRLAALAYGRLEDFVFVSFATGTATTLLLFAWSVRYAIRNLWDDDPSVAPEAGIGLIGVPSVGYGRRPSSRF